MANCIEQAKQALNALLQQAFDKAVAEGVFPAEAALRGSVEQPKDAANGDFAANHAMASAKALRMPPRKIAETLAAKLELAGSWFESAEIAGPGFMNFRLSPKWYADVLENIESEADAIMTDARNTALVSQAKIVAEAKTEAQSIIRRAENEIELERCV